MRKISTFGIYISLSLILLISSIQLYLTGIFKKSPRKLKECECAKPSGGQPLDFCYTNPTNGRRGRSFACKWAELLEWFGLASASTEVASPPASISPVFLTATSETHFRESLRGLAQTQHVFPAARIVVYDLGLARDQRRFLRSLCRLELRPFDFDKYFPLEKTKRIKLSACRWKPLIIAEMLREAESLWYMDASARWFEGAPGILESFTYPLVLNGTFAPYLLVDPTGHSVHATTHPLMYYYLPMMEKQRFASMMIGAGFGLIVRSPLVRRIMKWYVLCALERRCMLPEGANPNCHHDPGVNKTITWAGCHRYDQSALNILLGNEFDGNYRKYVSRGESFGFIDRRPGDMTWELQICNKTGNFSSLKM